MALANYEEQKNCGTKLNASSKAFTLDYFLILNLEKAYIQPLLQELKTAHLTTYFKYLN